MHNQKRGKKIQTNVKWSWEKHYISTKTNPKLKPNRRIPRNQNSNKNCIQKKGEKENLITKISWFCFATDLTTKEEEENVEIFKEKKKQKQKNLNPE